MAVTVGMYEKFEFSEHELEEFGEEWEGAREDDGGQPGATPHGDLGNDVTCVCHMYHSHTVGNTDDIDMQALSRSAACGKIEPELRRSRVQSHKPLRFVPFFS